MGENLSACAGTSAGGRERQRVGVNLSAARSDQRVRGKPRSTFEVPGSGQRDVTIFARV